MRGVQKLLAAAKAAPSKSPCARRPPSFEAPAAPTRGEAPIDVERLSRLRDRLAAALEG